MTHHYLSRYAPPDHTPSLYGYRHTYPQWLDLGTMGVQFFFIISGFVIFMTLQRCRHLFEFWIRRLARLYPAYLVATLLTFVIVNAVGPLELHRGAKDVLVGMSFLTPYVPGVRFVDGSYWSLVAEMQFYFAVGLIYTFCRSRFALAWAAYACIGAALWSLGGSHATHVLRTLARHVFLVESVPYFTAGILFYQLHAGIRRGSWLLALGMLASYAATCSYSISLATSATAPAFEELRPLVTAAMLVAFTLFVYNKLQWLAVRPLVFLGGISYSFYLLHQFIGVSLIPFFTRTLALPDLLAVLATAGICGTLAYLLTRLVEIPAKAVLLNGARRAFFPTLADRFPLFQFASMTPTYAHPPQDDTAIRADVRQGA